jgi:cystathionine beta-lyase
MRPNTKLVHTEAPGSNTFEMQDIPAIAEVAHAHGALVSMDNTWATPLFFKPLDHGVDISIHAATKYPAGHSDVLIGTVSANEAAWPALWKTFHDAGKLRRSRRQLHDLAGPAHHGREAWSGIKKRARNRQSA